MPKIEEKSETGKANYQQFLKNVIDAAVNELREGEPRKFCRSTWSAIRLVSTKMDKDKVMEFVEIRVNDNDDWGVTALRSKRQFIKFVTSDPYSKRKFLFDSPRYYPVWYDIYNIAREAYNYRYSGRLRTIKEDEIDDSVPDHLDESGNLKEDEIPYDGGY